MIDAPTFPDKKVLCVSSGRRRRRRRRSGREWGCFGYRQVATTVAPLTCRYDPFCSCASHHHHYHHHYYYYYYYCYYYYYYYYYCYYHHYYNRRIGG